MASGAFGSLFDFCRTLPEISGSMEYRFEGSTITPLPIPIADLADYQAARKWLGVLVTLDQVTLLEPRFCGGTLRVHVADHGPCRA